MATSSSSRRTKSSVLTPSASASKLSRMRVGADALRLRLEAQQDAVAQDLGGDLADVLGRDEPLAVEPRSGPCAARERDRGARRGAEPAPAGEVGVVAARLAAGLHDVHDVAVELRVEEGARGGVAQREQRVLRQDRARRRQRRLLPLVVELEDLQLLGVARVLHPHVHQEPVELGLRQVVRALLLDRVLGGEDHEQPRQRVGGLAHGDLALGHRLEQRRLDLGGGPVDLVGEQDVVEQGARPEFEVAALVPVDVGADQVRRQQVRRELYPVEIPLQAFREGLHGARLGQPGQALHQKVAVAQETDEHAVDQPALADHARRNVLAKGFQFRGMHPAGLADRGEMRWPAEGPAD